MDHLQREDVWCLGMENQEGSGFGPSCLGPCAGWMSHKRTSHLCSGSGPVCRAPLKGCCQSLVFPRLHIEQNGWGRVN